MRGSANSSQNTCQNGTIGHATRRRRARLVGGWRKDHAAQMHLLVLVACAVGTPPMAPPPAPSNFAQTGSLTAPTTGTPYVEPTTTGGYTVGSSDADGGRNGTQYDTLSLCGEAATRAPQWWLNGAARLYSLRYSILLVFGVIFACCCLGCCLKRCCCRSRRGHSHPRRAPYPSPRRAPYPSPRREHDDHYCERERRRPSWLYSFYLDRGRLWSDRRKDTRKHFGHDRHGRPPSGPPAAPPRRTSYDDDCLEA